MTEYAIVPASSPAHIELARALFREYAESLGFSLCFQGFDRELAELPGEYAPPDGALLLAMDGEAALGCAALKRLAEGICEMKRLYVRPQARGKGLGRRLAEAVIAEARRIGYRTMRLDTIGATMQDAIALYRQMGFYDIPPYYANPIEGAVYLERRLDNS